MRTRSAHINRETIVRLRRRQRHHPKSHRTHTKNVWCCWYLHTSVVHSTFHIWILLFCFFSFGFLSFFKICFSWQWKREAAQTISLMRYLQMLWRVETMLEICLEFVPLYRFLNLHKQRFSCKYFCRRFERGHQRCTHQTTHLQIRRLDFLFTHMRLFLKFHRIWSLAFIFTRACDVHYGHQWSLIEVCNLNVAFKWSRKISCTGRTQFRSMDR